VTDVGKACALRRGRSGHREIVTFIEVDDRSRDSRDRHELGPSRKYLNEVKALLASVRHTDARSGYGQEGSTSLPAAR